MRRLALLGVVVAALALVAANTGSGAPTRPKTTAGLISAIKGKVCDLLDGVETVELPISLAKFVSSGELEASTVILFGANKAMCGGGHVEKLFSLAHDWLLGAVSHPSLKLPGFSAFRTQLPTLVGNLAGLPILDVAYVSAPTVTFSRNSVGPDNAVPMTVNWLETGKPTNVVYGKSVPLAFGAKTIYWQAPWSGFVGRHSVPIGLKGGWWYVCVTPSLLARYSCGTTFDLTINRPSAEYINTHLRNGVTVNHGFFGSQVGVVGDSAYGTAYFN